MEIAQFLNARLDEREATARALPDVYGPRYVLADCAAKRQIIGRCETVLRSWQFRADGRADFPDVTRRERDHAYETLCDLASVYSVHPDFDPAWQVAQGVA